MWHPGAVTWCFRVRADLPQVRRLSFASSEWLIEDRGPESQVKLVSHGSALGDEPIPLSEASSVVLRGSGYTSEDEAMAAGKTWRARLMKSFSALQIGADFGDRAPQGGFMPSALHAAAAQGVRALNDVHGLMVFECEPSPIFLKLGSITGIVSSPHQRLVDAMNDAIQNGGLTEERQVTYDLFAASFTQPSADARFALLMMALESMIEPMPRPSESRRHVESLIEATKGSGLLQSEVNSITGTLSWLLNESIGQAGRSLAKTLEPRKYNDEAPAIFFTHCYEMRSRLMHGHHPLPTRNEIGLWAANLQVFVADLLAG